MRGRTIAFAVAAVLSGSSGFVIAQTASKEAQTPAKKGLHSGAQTYSAHNGGSADGLPYNTIETTRDGIKYVTGGIGIEAQERLNARKDDFNLKLVFTLEQGAYIADVGVTVKDAQGRTVIEDVADGPFFMAQLPPGRYSIEARYDGKAVKRTVHVGKQGTRTAYLRWPADPETDFVIAGNRGTS